MYTYILLEVRDVKWNSTLFETLYRLWCVYVCYVTVPL